ncbi:MAG: GntR family transcriptional regulator [Enterocloster sp.]
MEYEHQLSNLIYDYLLNRFRFGYYQYGDSLPTVDVFCRLFNVSAHPIWTALRRLRADGYIDMKNGRISKVIYINRRSRSAGMVLSLIIFSQRWTSYLDIYRTSRSGFMCRL